MDIDKRKKKFNIKFSIIFGITILGPIVILFGLMNGNYQSGAELLPMYFWGMITLMGIIPALNLEFSIYYYIKHRKFPEENSPQYKQVFDRLCLFFAIIPIVLSPMFMVCFFELVGMGFGVYNIIMSSLISVPIILRIIYWIIEFNSKLKDSHKM